VTLGDIGPRCAHLNTYRHIHTCVRACVSVGVCVCVFGRSFGWFGLSVIDYLVLGDWSVDYLEYCGPLSRSGCRPRLRIGALSHDSEASVRGFRGLK
jgi:hypothetical protein